MDKLGNYTIGEELGRGGMGVVYRGTHVETGQVVALKVLPAQLALDPTFYTRFRREIQTLRQLDHPGIVKIYEDGEQEGALYYAMEFVAGRPLDEVLREGRLAPREATRIMLECSRVLEYAHVQGVVHRDIKPPNIMITPAGGVKLMDFGIAKLVDATRMTATQGVLGTVEFMSPEQSAGRFVDPRSDIYSLGVVYYRAVTGKLPITGETTTQVLLNLRTKQVEQPMQWVPDLPPRLNDLIMQMLAKEPEKRVPSARALSRELELLLRRFDAPAQPAPVYRGGRREQTRWYRNGWLWAAAALAVGMGVWWALRPPVPPAAERLARAQKLAAGRGVDDKRAALEQIALLLREHPDTSVRAEAQELQERIERELHTAGSAKLMFFNANVLYRRSADKDGGIKDLRGLRTARDLFARIITAYPDTEHAEKAKGCIQEIDNLLKSAGVKMDTDAAVRGGSAAGNKANVGSPSEVHE